MFDRISKSFKKSFDVKKRAKAAFENGTMMCESCGEETPLTELETLTISPCPKCGFNGFVPCLLNDYLLFEPLGAGGVSSVYKAVRRDTLHEKEFYAVKILRTDKDVDEQARSDFLFEAQAHHDVGEHPGIVRFIELDHDERLHYHAMEYIAGESVRRRVELKGRLPEKQAVAWTLQALDALRHILSKGYLYRDISPGNLLIREDGGVTLIDFGLILTREDADRADESRPIDGTPEYIPPERLQHAGEDERSVIYSLGMVLAFMLKGEPLIKRGSGQKAALQHISTLRVAFSDGMLPPETSMGTIEVVRGMIKYDAVDRPQSFDILEKMLHAVLK